MLQILPSYFNEDYFRRKQRNNSCAKSGWVRGQKRERQNDLFPGNQNHVVTQDGNWPQVWSRIIAGETLDLGVSLERDSQLGTQ